MQHMVLCILLPSFICHGPSHSVGSILSVWQRHSYIAIYQSMVEVGEVVVVLSLQSESDKSTNPFQQST